VLNENWVILGACLNLIGTSSYAIDTIKGKVKPNKISWLLWAIAPLIAFSAQVSQSFGLISLMTFAVGFGPLVIFISSFINKKAYWKITKFDIVCAGFSVIGLVLWQITKIGNIAILFSLLADGLASVPTILKSYKFPETESWAPFTIGTIGALISLLTVTNWSFGYIAFPIYIMSVNSIISFLIYTKIGKKK
jgi:hypothetical protein